MKRLAKIISILLVLSMCSTCIYATDTTLGGAENDVNIENVGDIENPGDIEDEEVVVIEYHVTDIVMDNSEIITDEDGNEKVKLDFKWTVNDPEKTLAGVDVLLYKGTDYKLAEIEQQQDLAADEDGNIAEGTSFSGLEKSTVYTVIVKPYTLEGEEKVYCKESKGFGIYLEKPAIEKTEVAVNNVIVDIVPVEGANKYIVSAVADGVEEEFEAVGKTATLELGYNKTYELKVKACFEQAVNEEGQLSTCYSEWSDPVSVVTGEFANARPVLKLSPYNLGAVLDWSKIAGASSYEVWRQYNGGEWVLLKTVDANTLTYKNTGLKSGKKYTYKVAAINEYGERTRFSEWKSLTATKYLTGTTIKLGYSSGKLKVASKLYKEGSTSVTVSSTKLKRGTKVTILDRRTVGKHQMSYVKLSSGKCYWIKTCNINHSAPYTKLDYVPQVKEEFVNSKGYSSDTKYLLFIAHYTQKVYLFEGSKGNWKLKKTFKCATGKASTRTPVGVFKIYKKAKRTPAGSKYVTYFKSANAFHARPSWSKAMSYPASNGCIRMYTNDAIYIQQNMPNKTTVVSF